MLVHINGLPLNIEFNFSGKSENKLAVVTDCCSLNKPFVLYADDKDFEVFIPELLVSFDRHKEIVQYKSIVEFQVALGFCVMCYDYACPIYTGINATAHLQLHTSDAPPALSPGKSIK